MNDDCKVPSKIDMATIATPEILEMPISPLKRDLKFFLKKIYTLPIIYTATLNNVFYHSRYNAIFNHKRQLISESVEYGEKNLYKIVKKFSIRYLYLTKVEKISGTCAVFRSIRKINNYYHSLIEHIPRLYLLDQPEYKKIQKIKLLIPSELNYVEKFFVPKLIPKNIEICIVNPQKLFLLEKLIFPSFLTSPSAGYLPQEYLQWFLPKVTPKRNRNKINKIFISRNKAKFRRIANEDEFFEMLSNYGFKKYNLEDISVEEQVELFYDASDVIGVHGAGLSNIIFSDQINVLEIFPERYIRHTHYYYLAKSLGHKYQYCCGKDNQLNRYSTSFDVSIEDVEKMLVQIIK